jgi:hypothetical protein
VKRLGFDEPRAKGSFELECDDWWMVFARDFEQIFLGGSDGTFFILNFECAKLTYKLDCINVGLFDS